jgi:hypothetical protein
VSSSSHQSSCSQAPRQRDPPGVVLLHPSSKLASSSDRAWYSSTQASSKAAGSPGHYSPPLKLRGSVFLRPPRAPLPELSPTQVSPAPVLLHLRAPIWQASSPAVFIRGASLSHMQLRPSSKSTSSSIAVLLLRFVSFC